MKQRQVELDREQFDERTDRMPDVTLTDGKLYARRFDDTLQRYDVSQGYLTVTKV